MTRSSSTRSRAVSGEFDPISGLLAIGVILGSLSLSLPFLWTLTVMVAGLTIVFFINRWLREQRLQRLRRQQLLDLSPSEFEQRVALLLEDLGWRQVTVRGGSGDRGVDITAERDGLRFIIQCKRYTKPVGPSYVRDLVGALQIQQAGRPATAPQPREHAPLRRRAGPESGAGRICALVWGATNQPLRSPNGTNQLLWRNRQCASLQPPSWQRQRLQPPPRALLPPHALPAPRNRRPRHSQPQHRRQSTQPPPSLTAATCGPSQP